MDQEALPRVGVDHADFEVASDASVHVEVEGELARVLELDFAVGLVGILAVASASAVLDAEDDL